MKTLVYNAPVDNAKDQVARIAVATDEIRDMPECSDFYKPET